jgi:flavin-dependent dehydrogenase
MKSSNRTTTTKDLSKKIRYSEVIIVGGGPAGSSCAYTLNRADIECLILDKSRFPRKKLCAGWITPKVLTKLDLNISDYAGGIIHFDTMQIHLPWFNKRIKTRQYSIRRYEFDDFMLKRSNVKVELHEVKNIRKEDNYYIIDEMYRCKYIIGAGGTFCPVYRTFFAQMNPRTNKQCIIALESEFKYDYKNKECHLWFFKNKLPGYAWYVPKEGRYLNIGIGGKFEDIKDKNNDIKSQWDHFVKELKISGLIKDSIRLKPEGYVYYLRQNVDLCRKENAFIIGDAAGLATTDLGEGIEPSIESGIICAESIINNIKKFSLKNVKRRSFSTKEYLKFIIK